MGNFASVVGTAAGKWRRDARLPLAERLAKAAAYARALVAAPWVLRNVTSRGHSTRLLGTPHIENHGRMVLGDSVMLRSVTIPVELYTAPGAEIVIGNGCIFNSGSSVCATRSVILGQRVFVGGLAYIMDSSFHDVTDRDIHPPGRPVVLEDDVWVGVKATVMPGVRIGRGSVVAAHSVVTHDVPPHVIVAGAPARVVRALEARPAAAVPP
jgi:acetyltransferase-like isoleucine patch superfamily enzyme